MSDTAATPSSGQGFPTFAGDAAPQPGAVPATPELRREAAQRLMSSPDYTSENAAIRGPLVREVQRLLAADNPTDRRPRDAVTGMVDAPPPAAPPANSLELHAALSNHVTFPAHVPMADRADFLDVSGAGLAALGASRTEAGWFSHAAGEVLRAPDSFTPETAEKALRATWGGAYETNLRAAQHAVRRLPPAVRAHLTETPIGNHPRVMQILADAGRRMQGPGRR